MSNQVNSMNKGLTVKDLVTTGIFTALLFVFVLVGGVFFATNPVLTFFMPAGGGLLAGPIYLLLIAKVHMCVLSSMFAPSLAYQFVLVMLIAVLGAFFGKWKYVIKAVCFYAVICALTVWIMAEMTGTLRTMFIAFLGLFHKVYACGTLAGIVLTTTKVNEFLSAMNRVHAPKKLVIPMAVMLRYIPTIQEDWRYIKDAMRMRDVSPSLASFLAHPGMTVECIYVPLLMAASKAADDLSVASVTRGIENPNPRTCLVQIKCGAADWGVMTVAVAYLIFELCVRGGVIG